VVVLANLKPRNMRGIKSNGMLLCASNDAHDQVRARRPLTHCLLGRVPVLAWPRALLRAAADTGSRGGPCARCGAERR
jgi:tRNA-binding EMAP/Myf-like protein